MKSSKKIIKRLNNVLRNELTAINQYFLHARILKNWGLKQLGEKEYQESIEEMHHADWLIERILFLEGLPNLQDLGKLWIGEDVEEVLKCDLKREHEGAAELRGAIADAEQASDYVTRDLFRKILDNEEEHIDWIETQLELIERVGIELYQQRQM